MQLSIVLPAFNEEPNIEEAARSALERVRATSGELILVNDGSSDGTREIVERIVREQGGLVRAIHHPENQGYGAALRDGFAAARGDWIFYTDSDNQYDLAEMDRLWRHASEAEIVVGYRQNRQDTAYRIFAARVFNGIARTLFSIGVRDIDCPFKLFRRSVFERIRIRSDGFLVDTEILAKARRARMRVREVPVSHRARQRGESTVRPRHVLEVLRDLPRLWLEVRRQT